MADDATLKSQYLAQVDADLERNTKETERLSAEVAALRKQLLDLETDQALLVTVRNALGSTTPSAPVASDPAQAPAEAASATVPKARKSRQAAATPKAAKKRSATKARRTATGADHTDAAETAETVPAPNVSEAPDSSNGTVTLRELVTGHLSRNTEPHSAAEVTTVLARTHPERRIQATVVRNTLEALVAKGHVTRTRQNRSVFYTATGADSAVVPAEESADGSVTAEAAPTEGATAA